VNVEEALEQSRENVQKVIEICRRPGRMLILMQDNPDPDALACAAALREFAFHHAKKRADIGYGGVCGRAENRAMMDVLHIHAKRLSAAQISPYRIIALVDAQPNTGNNLLLKKRVPNIVIDHHLMPKRAKWTTEFADVRPEYGAACTILYEYLTVSGVKINRNLATALFYGMQSDTQDLGREASIPGMHAYQELFIRADKKKLARIRRAPVPAAYFNMLAVSLSECVIAGKTVISHIPECDNAEMIAEVADLLLRLEGVRSTVCYGLCDGKIYISARAVDLRDNMARRMKQAVRMIGTGGGHRAMAGGQVLVNGDAEKRMALVRERLLKAFARGKEARPLLPQPQPEEAVQ